jgi:glycosyltransferase involved in cell wall biosynthesis
VSFRILLTSDFYAPFIGGAERQVQYLAIEMAQRGHDASVATVWHAGQPEHELRDGIMVHRIKGWSTRVPWFSSDPNRRFHPPFPDPGIAWGLRRLIDRLQPDIVHANGWIAYSCAAALVGRRIPLVVSVRDYGYSCAVRTLMHGEELCGGPAPAKCLACSSQRYGPAKALAAVGGVFASRPLLARKTVAAHSVSTFVQKIVRRDLFGAAGAANDQSRCTIIPDIVNIHRTDDPAEHDADARFLASLPTDPFILFVGALQLHKGLAPLLAAYGRLELPRQDIPPLVLIGSVWPDSPTDFPAGITVLRNVPHHQVMLAWERCLFGVVPSVWPDPLPGVVKEGMSQGKAIVGSAIGGIVDMIDDERTGLLVEPGDVPGLARAMARLSTDAGLRERLGKAAQARIDDFGQERVVPQFEQLYRQLAVGAAGGRG